ncbi:uncharacterized protein LOC120824813 isoform X1 [Gasterosteus aculeatus]
MWPTETPTRAAGLLCVLLAVVSASTEITIYRKLGDGVVLRPVNISVSSTIVWKQDGNLAAEWEGAEITLYRDFKGRGRLNTSNGELTITGLTPKENGFYTLETKEMAGPKIHLIVISPVPKPTVSKQCDPDRTLCTLSCDGDVADAAPVTYRWSPGDTAASKELRLAKEDSWEVQEFRCVLQNPVSQESSEPVPNPFSKGGSPSTLQTCTFWPRRALTSPRGLLTLLLSTRKRAELLDGRRGVRRAAGRRAAAGRRSQMHNGNVVLPKNIHAMGAKLLEEEREAINRWVRIQWHGCSREGAVGRGDPVVIGNGGTPGHL